MISSKKSLTIIILVFHIFSEKVCHADHKDFILVTMTNIEFFSNGTDHVKINVGLDNMTAAAFDPIKNEIYVCAIFEKLFRLKINEKMEYYANELIIDKPDRMMIGIAFDHRNSTLYWKTGNGIFYVVVRDYKTKVKLTRQILLTFNEKSDTEGLVINVHRRYVYWLNIDRKTNRTAIEGSSLDRPERKVLVEGLTDPLHFTVDEDGNTLYWVNMDERLDFSVDSADLRDRGVPRTLADVAGKQKPSVIAQDDDNVYWMDYKTNKLWAMPKDSSNPPVQASSGIQSAGVHVELFVVSDGNAKRPGEEDGGGSNISRFLNHHNYRTNRYHNH